MNNFKNSKGKNLGEYLLKTKKALSKLDIKKNKMSYIPIIKDNNQLDIKINYEFNKEKAFFHNLKIKNVLLRRLEEIKVTITLKNVYYQNNPEQARVYPTYLSDQFFQRNRPQNMNVMDNKGLLVDNHDNQVYIDDNYEQATIELTWDMPLSDISFMFYKCSDIISIDLSKFNTENVEEMNYTFSGCTSLTSLNLSNLITSKARYMNGMLSDCYNLETLNLGSLNTSKVENMELMFFGLYKLETLDLSAFDTSQVTNMGLMFGDCHSLKSLDLSNFKIPNIQYMYSMFFNSHSLESLIISNFKGGDEVEIQRMFLNCSSLQSINLSSFDTSM